MIFCQNEGNKIIIKAVILLELKDETTRKRIKNSGMSQESIRNNSGLDTDKEAEVYKEQNKTPFSARETQGIFSVLRQNNTDPERPRGMALIAYLKKKRPNNPAGYLVGILKENPTFDPQQDGGQYESPRHGDFQRAGDVLKTMAQASGSGQQQ